MNILFQFVFNKFVLQIFFFSLSFVLFTFWNSTWNLFKIQQWKMYILAILIISKVSNMNISHLALLNLSHKNQSYDEDVSLWPLQHLFNKRLEHIHTRPFDKNDRLNIIFRLCIQSLCRVQAKRHSAKLDLIHMTVWQCWSMWCLSLDYFYHKHSLKNKTNQCSCQCVKALTLERMRCWNLSYIIILCRIVNLSFLWMKPLITRGEKFPYYLCHPGPLEISKKCLIEHLRHTSHAHAATLFPLGYVYQHLAFSAYKSNVRSSSVLKNSKQCFISSL